MELLEVLYEKDDKKAYNRFLELISISKDSNELYPYMRDIIEMLYSEKSFIRVRGFRLICALAKWDDDNIIDKNIDTILYELNDEKPTSVRQCLKSIEELIIFKPELKDRIISALHGIDITKYKDSMSPLIEKDIDKLLQIINYNL